MRLMKNDNDYLIFVVVLKVNYFKTSFFCFYVKKCLYNDSLDWSSKDLLVYHENTIHLAFSLRINATVWSSHYEDNRQNEQSKHVTHSYSANLLHHGFCRYSKRTN